MKYKLHLIGLSLFEGDGASGGATAGPGAPASAGGQSGEGQSNLPPLPLPTDTARARRAKANNNTTGDNLSQVVYGSAQAGNDQAAVAAGQDADGKTAEDAPTAEEWNALKAGRFKDFYTKDTQQLINRRFAQAKQQEAENAAMRSIVETLNEKYGITDDADFSKLSKALEADDAIWEEKADEQGMTVDQYKQYRQMKRKAEAFDAARQNDALAQQRQETAQRWAQEAQALKQIYPGFDIRNELSDQGFMAALQAGAPMRMIYEGKYHSQLMQQANAQTAARTEKAVTDNIRAKGNRPQENGASSGAGFTYKQDPSKLTMKDFEEIQRRVARGEKISF